VTALAVLSLAVKGCNNAVTVPAPPADEVTELPDSVIKALGG
jgi:hypothetical protein